MRTISKRTISYEEFKADFKPVAQKLDSSYKKAWKYNNFCEMPIKTNYIFYESHQGTGIMGIPKNIFLSLLSDPTYTHVWSIEKNSKDELTSELNFYSSLGNVKLAVRGSEEYYQYLATCEYLITNSYFISNFYKRPKQRMLFTGDYFTTTSIGYKKNILKKKNEQYDIRHCLQSDAILSFGDDYKHKILENAYKLSNIYQGKIIECGLPKYKNNSNLQHIALEKASKVSAFSTKPLILILPDTYHKTTCEIDALVIYYENLLQKIISDSHAADFCVLFSVPRNAYKRFCKSAPIKNHLLPVHCDIRDLTEKISCVITDAPYSSVFFKEKNIPVVPATSNECAISDDFSEVSSMSVKEIWNIFTNKASEMPYTSYLPKTKKQLLFFAAFSNDKETTYLDSELLYQLQWIDYTLYDVTLIVPYFPWNNQLILNSIDSRIRLFDFSGRFPFSKEEYYQHNYLSKHLMNAENVLKTVNPSNQYMHFYQKNISRILGNITFDYFIYYGELTNTNYLFSCGFSFKHSCFLRTLSVQKEKIFFHESDFRKFLYKNRCFIYDSFEKIFFFDQHLLNEAKETEPDLYAESKLIRRVPGKFQNCTETISLPEAIYQKKAFLAVKFTDLYKEPSHILLVPKPNSKEDSILHVVQSQMDQISLRNMAEQFKSFRKTHITAKLYLVDNFNFINDLLIQNLSVEYPFIVVVRYVPIVPQFISYFSKIVSTNSFNSLEYHKKICELYHIPVIQIDKKLPPDR